MLAMWFLIFYATAMATVVAANGNKMESRSSASADRPAHARELPNIQWVRDGVVLASASELKVSRTGENIKTGSVDLTAGRRWARFAWQAGEEYEFTIAGRAVRLRAPQAPTPIALHTVALEDVGQAAAAGSAPDAVVRFSPDGRQLAIGSFGGWLRIVDAHNGTLLHRRRIVEGMVKQLAWSPDGSRLYVGEQSPDARLLAISVETDTSGTIALRDAWSLRLADQLHTSRPPAEDRYGIYTLPAVYDLHVVEDGRLYVAGVHSWREGGEPRKRCVVYCINADGTTRWRFPAEDAWSNSVTHLAVDPRGTKVIFLPGPIRGESDNLQLPANTVYQLDAATGRVAARLEIAPLRPHFTHVESWDSVSLSDDAATAVVGLADGRAFLLSSTERALDVVHQFDLGTPLVVGQIPVAAACSYARIFGNQVYLQTQNSHIPFGNPAAAHRAPSLHRGANTLTVADLSGKTQWKYRGPYALGGVWSNHRPASYAPGRLVATCRPLPEQTAPAAFGLLLFDLGRAGGGRDRLVYHYPTAGPVGFAADVSADGRLIAVVEVPAPTPDGESLYGTYQVHVVH